MRSVGQTFIENLLFTRLPAMWETWVRLLGWEDPLEKGKATYTPVFWPGEFHGLYSPRSRKESDTTEQLSLTAIYQAFRVERKNTGYFAHAFEELEVWLWKRSGMHVVVVGEHKAKRTP